MVVKACVKVEEKNVQESSGSEWGKVSAVLFDMDGVLCNSEELSRRAAVEVFAEMGVETTVEDFIPFGGTGNISLIFNGIVDFTIKILLYLYLHCKVIKFLVKRFEL